MSSTTDVSNNSLSLNAAQPCCRFSLAEIQSATSNFDDKLVIGHGRFGKVYKGCICTNETSQVVAVKRLDSMSNQGLQEFTAEIEMLSKLRHCHLVSLIGFCEDNKEMILVYDYMPNGTLYDSLHKFKSPLNWVKRLKIAIGAARGLDYLHTGVGIQHGVIHRDVKTSNILLDENRAAMISDFGLSKIGPTNQSSSYIDASVKGTFGYLDPEYLYTRKLTRKTDVYAFGVVLFVLLSGRLPVDERYGEEECSLGRWAKKCVNKLDQLVDSHIRETIFSKCLRRFAQIAYRCLLSDPKEQPTMTEVVASLQAQLELQNKYVLFSKSPGMMGFTWKFHKYLVSSTNPNSATNGTWVGGSKSGDAPAAGASSGGLAGITVDKSVEFSYEELSKATDDFSLANKIGQGGFGAVYYAELRGEKAAIKKMDMQASREFLAELKFLTHVYHLNLVHLIGYCVEGSFFLVYEYLENGNLHQHLHGSGRDPLLWSTRVQIALDSASGLEHIHEHTVPVYIHRHIKSTNILIDKNFHGKVADFSLTMRNEFGSTSLPTRVVGTFGYIAPEYALYGDVSPKADVYAFGVVLYELISAKEALVYANGSVAESMDLVALFDDVLSQPDPKDELVKMIDPRLGDNYPLDSVHKMAQLAKACTHENPQLRPSMRSIVVALMTLSSSTKDRDVVM